MSDDDPTRFFWTIAEPLLAEDAVTRGTMMGFPCLRADGAFFASAEPKSGDLIVKLPADRVTAMVDAGEGDEFAPAGRRFREWVRVSDRSAARWTALMREGLAFVRGAGA